MFIPLELVLVSVYVVVACLCFFVAVRWRLVREGGRFPVPDDIRLRRRAGEALSHDLIRLGERFDRDAFLFLGLPLLAVSLPVLLVKSLSSSSHPVALVSCGAFFLAAMIYTGKQLLGTCREMRNKRLALYGERVTGDQLMELAEHGYAIFHDVPCQGGGGRFNLDHVVVGQGTVVVVETKTYRKPRDVPDAHRVTYDGNLLHWPGRSSKEELTQVTAAANWLQAELKRKLCLDVPVRAALTIPGWYVIGGPPKAPVLVEHVGRLPQFIRQRFVGTLAAAEEKLVRNHLRSMCEDICFQTMEV